MAKRKPVLSVTSVQSGTIKPGQKIITRGKTVGTIQRAIRVEAPALDLAAIAAQLNTLQAAIARAGVTNGATGRAPPPKPKSGKGVAGDAPTGEYDDDWQKAPAAEQLYEPRDARPDREDLPPLDELQAALEEVANFKEGNRKLSLAVDTLRLGLETVVSAEYDKAEKRPTDKRDLQGIAVGALNQYSQISGQSWRRHRIIGNWAGGTGNAPVWPEKMR